MFFHMVYKSGQIFLPFCHNSRVWRTDRRTDGQTEFSSLDRVCIPCSAVKTWAHLRQLSFPDIIMWHFLTVTPIVVLAVALLL